MNRALIGLCFLLLACGKVVPIEGTGDAGNNSTVDGGSGGPDANIASDPCAGPVIALENIEECLLQYQCEFMVRCFPGFPDAEFCEPRLFDFFALLNSGAGDGGGGGDGPTPLLFDIFRRAVAADVSNYNGANAFTCLDKMKRLSCGSEGGGVDECEYILNSEAPTGSDCHDDFECAMGDYCLGDALQTCSINGTCRTGLDVGQNCNIDRCKPHLQCVRLGGGNQATCEDGSAGSKCSESRECDPGFFCGNSQCVAKLPLGASGCELSEQCSGDEQCVGGICSSVNEAGQTCEGVCWGNLYCDANGVCQPMPGQGQDCSVVPDGSAGKCNSVDLVCGVAQDCLPRGANGSPCGNGPSPCQLGLFCTSELGDSPGQCAQRLGNNQNCFSDTHCESGFCGGVDPNRSCQTYVACWE